MAICDRCGKKIKHPMGIRKTTQVGFLASVFNVRMEDITLCPECAASFRRWLFCRLLNENVI